VAGQSYNTIHVRAEIVDVGEAVEKQQAPGQVVILNGPPRSGKSSIAVAIQDSFDDVWMNLGVDHFKHMTPARFQPGVGLRPGGERPELEPLVVRLYRAMYEAIAAHSRLGINVVVDAVHHDAYSVPRQILRTCARQLDGLPVLFVGVRCPVDVALERRRATWGGVGYHQGGAVEDPVGLWHEAVHRPGIYDLEVDTSVLRPEQCADLIAARLADGPHPRAFDRIAALPADESASGRALGERPGAVG
jgi:chloramphenicol 3-O phosphotransferase